MVYLKILQSDWPKAFWPKSQEPDLSQEWDLHKSTVNNINFKKTIITNFPINSENPIFGPFFTHFPHFWGKKNF